MDETATEKPKAAESAGVESSRQEGPYGSPATWELKQLPLLAFRVMGDHKGFFGALIAISFLVEFAPFRTNIISLFVTLAAVAAGLHGLGTRETMPTSHILGLVNTRGGTLILAQLTMLLGLGLLGGGLFVLAGKSSLFAHGGPGDAFWFVVIGIPAAFLLSMPFFLAAVVLDTQGGAIASLVLAVALYLKNLPGNLAIVLLSWVAVFGGIFGLAFALPASFAGPASGLWAAITGVWANVLVAARYRQLQAWAE